MKKELFFSLFFIWGFISAQNVSTEIEKKSILVENFTGIHCGFCPQGHAVVHTLLMAHPEKTFAIAIHAGNYATPSPDEPDFIVPDGVTIHDGLGAGEYGYPSGTINRRALGSDLITGRGSWILDAKSVYEEEAPVNLYLQSVYDGATKELTIHVELYYTADVEQDANYLSIAYVEDNVIGPQSGANAGDNYKHQHMLRGYITDVWGDVVENPKKGLFVEKDYTFTLPEYINSVPVSPSGIRLVAFVTADKKDVLNATGGKPSYVNYEKPLGATLSHPDFVISSAPSISRAYCFNYFDLQLENQSNIAIEKADFDVIINGESQKVSWSGNIPSFERSSIRIHVKEYPIEANNTYSIQLTSINGQNFSGNTLTGQFNGTTSCTSKLFVEIQTDNHADDNHFLIKTRDGEIVKTLGPYVAGVSATYNEEIELEENKIYCFEILDEWGDGIKEPSRGLIKLYNSDQSLFYMTYDIADWGLRIPLETSKNMSIAPAGEINATIWNIDHTSRTINLKMNGKKGIVNIELYAIDGKKLYSNSTNANNLPETVSIPMAKYPAGIYLIKITDNIKTEVFKIFIN